ncbi:MAG: hypothetical protein ACQCN5_03935 [Candidatus Bathyarchaeia archaeon]|jgi:hypothetical protein
MEKIFKNQKSVELENYFEGVWASLWRVGKEVCLKTEYSKKGFLVKAKLAKRNGCVEAEEVLVFYRINGFGVKVECSRCYAADWGLYFNHLGNGQRIGMYCKSIDCWVTRQALESEVD